MLVETLSTFIYAFIGGLLLNVMPCVFPILSLKAMQVLQGGESQRGLRMHSLLFTTGVVISFWILVAALLMLKAGGEKLGWGFQLQYPGFVVFVAVVLFLWGLNLLDVFVVGTKLQNVAGSVAVPKGHAGAFFTGVLATMIATPCTAPFMGSAIPIALALPWFGSLAVLTSMALGMAFPYLLLGFMPGIAKVLPRPGAWMETMKNIMSFPLFVTSWWLLTVYYAQMGGDALFNVLLAMIILSFAAFIYGMSQNPLRKRRSRRVLQLIAFAISLTAYYQVASQEGKITPSVNAGSSTEANDQVMWQPYSPALIARLSSEQKPVFIDFTAAWCVTCQVNKKLVLNTKRVENFFKERKIAAIRADWTDQNDEISQALDKLERNGVPVYALYYPGAEKPYLFPTLLTVEGLEQTIKELLPPKSNHK